MHPYTAHSSLIRAWRAYMPLPSLSCYKYRCAYRPPCKKINIVRNNHRHTQRWEFSVLDREHTFRANLVQKIKIVSLSWNLVPRLIWTCTVQWWCWFFSVFDPKYVFWANLTQKSKICSLNWSLVPRLIRIWRIQWWCSFFVAFDRKDSFWVQICSKNIKFFCWSWNLEPRLIQICRIRWWFFIFSFLDRKYYFSIN